MHNTFIAKVITVDFRAQWLLSKSAVVSFMQQFLAWKANIPSLEKDLANELNAVWARNF